MMLLGIGLGEFMSGGRESYRWGEWLFAVIWAVVAVLLFDGYFILFELLMHGQTPGKKAMKIRVMRDDGTPVTANEVLVRNILRLVDFLPFGYALGAVVMFPSPLSKRLGDLAAGTIVVKEGQLDYRAYADDKGRSLPDCRRRGQFGTDDGGAAGVDRLLAAAGRTAAQGAAGTRRAAGQAPAREIRRAVSRRRRLSRNAWWKGITMSLDAWLA